MTHLVNHPARRMPLCSLLLLLSLTVLMSATQLRAQQFSVGDGSFQLDGKPWTIKAAELHYPRIPRPYWDHRIKMVKALGMNTVCLYVFWNLHEPEPGRFDFSDNADLREFIRLCDANGMKVILRPGPYVCAEWEMGGLPWWLLRQPGIRLREPDPYFLERVRLFEQAVADQVSDLTDDKGGPIIMIQVENEYGSYGTDKEYIGAIRDVLRELYGEKVTLFQCDWASNFLKNGLDDLLWTMNFGTGADVDKQFARLGEVRPLSPKMCSEYWSGWFDKWGARHETRPAAKMIDGIDEMLSKGISFSLYMTHGGTSFGHWSGANSPGYAPDVTSYDYDAPIDEQGRPTEKYHLLRSTLARYSDGTLPPIPECIPVVAVSPFMMSEIAPIFTRLPQPVRSDSLLTMESMNQGFGSLLYRTRIAPRADSSRLIVSEPHDFAQVFADGRYIGSLDRRKAQTSLSMPPASTSDSVTLDILVEGMGRINFGRAIKDFKGITDCVSLDSVALKGWEIYPLPDSDDYYTSLSYYPLRAFEPDGVSGRWPRGVYRGTFEVDSVGDTFLDLSGWGKGLAYVNGHALGRFWEIGPQQTLYTPGCWLRKGRNDLMIFDIVGPLDPHAEGLTKPILNKLNTKTSTKAKKAPKLEGLTPAATGKMHPGNGWQQIDFDRVASGRYLIIEAIDAIDGGKTASIAELYCIAPDRSRLPREGWRAVYADSEDTGRNLTADKSFDLQESTSWTTADNAPYPHLLIIDLGREETIGALQVLPRMEPGQPGAIGRYRIYLTDRRP